MPLLAARQTPRLGASRLRRYLCAAHAGLVRETAAAVLVAAGQPYVETIDNLQKTKQAAISAQRVWRACRAIKQRKLAWRRALETLRGSLVFRRVPTIPSRASSRRRRPLPCCFACCAAGVAPAVDFVSGNPLTGGCWIVLGSLRSHAVWLALFQLSAAASCPACEYT